MISTAGAKPCPEWCDVIITRKDRSKPVVVREYLDEVYVPPRGGYAGPWQSHTKRMLRHKTLIQGSRIAFGFSGIYDEDEAGRILEAHHVSVQQAGKMASTTDELAAQLAARGAQLADQERDQSIDVEFTDSVMSIHSAMACAINQDQLDEAADRIRFLDASDRAPLTDYYHVRMNELENC